MKLISCLHELYMWNCIWIMSCMHFCIYYVKPSWLLDHEIILLFSPNNVDHRCFIIVYLTKMAWSESFSLFWLFLEQEEAEYTHFYERKVIFISTHKLKGWIEIGSFSTCTKRILEEKNFLSTLFSLHCCWKSGFWKKRSPYLYCSNYHDRIAWIFAFCKGITHIVF